MQQDSGINIFREKLRITKLRKNSGKIWLWIKIRQLLKNCPSKPRIPQDSHTKFVLQIHFATREKSKTTKLRKNSGKNGPWIK